VRFATGKFDEVAMSRGKPTVIGMLVRRFLAIATIVAIVAPFAALARENTTAVWSDNHTSALSDDELVRYALASPGPGYPEEAQRGKIGGSGVYELRINKAGKTTEVVIVTSSGSRILDQAARGAFMKWRFKAGAFIRIRLPVSWSVSRVH
jgi:TonB family protein